MGNITVTIFTPTYNRDKYISNLYHSLCAQSVLPFEWIVVDQGNDNTEELVKRFQKEASFPIIYRKLDNERGIGRAFNLMVKIAGGKLVMKVDDDDTLTTDAIESIIEMEDSIIEKKKYAGVSGLRQYPDGSVIGGEWKHKTEWLDCTNFERDRYGLGGDKAEAYYLNVLKQYGPMPVVPGEYFTWEAVLWDRIAHAGKMIRWFNKKIYCTEYLPGGATNTRITARKDNFFTYTIYVSERLKYHEVSFVSRLKICCRYFELLREKKLSYYEVKQYFYDCRGMVFFGYLGSIFTKKIPERIKKY